MDEQKKDGTGGANHEPLSRRRGAALESAILQAAWAELSDVGYTHLTMEGVAARAKTNKAVVYRRWPNKVKLVLAALHAYLPRPDSTVPDTGNLQEDLLRLLRSIALPLQAIGAETIHGLMVDYLGKDLIATIPQTMQADTEGKMALAMKTILKNAEARGEVKLEKIKPRIISLPIDLLRYELLVTHEPLSEQKINEIVDDIFIPLVSRSVE
jgi:AcrR family transcriptional regulator